MAAASSDERLLVPYRALGLVSLGPTPSVLTHADETFVTTSVGRSFKIYSAKKLRCVFSSPQLDGKITAIANVRADTAVALGQRIFIFDRQRVVLRFETDHASPVMKLLPMGDVLISLHGDGVILAWDLKAMPVPRVASRLHVAFKPTAICHPATYMNKILIGAPDGTMELWNLRSKKRVHAFVHDWSASVMALEQSPALDVVAAGLADGHVYIHQLKFDKTLHCLKHDGAGAANGLAFRTDGTPWLVVATSNGTLTVWNLERGIRLFVLGGAHIGDIACTHFLRGSPRLLTAGRRDNSLRTWTADTDAGASAPLRPLSCREGPTAAPRITRFHGGGLHVGGAPAGQTYVLAAGGQDRSIRLLSIWSSHQDTALSQKAASQRTPRYLQGTHRLLPTVSGFASSARREREWANLVTIHEGDAAARTWDVANKVLGPHTLPTRDGSAASSVDISPCGSFAYLGSAHGGLDKFNIQSGIRRASASTPGSKGCGAHSGRVTGVAALADGRAVFSCGSDRTLKLWRASDLGRLQSCDIAGLPTILRLAPDALLVALACDDLSVSLFTVDSYWNLRMVRRFTGHTNTLSDVAWAPDARWIFTSALDRTLRIIDVPSGTTIGVYSFPQTVTSIGVSPGGEFIVTSHVDRLGLCVWANRAAFTSVTPRAAGAEPTYLELPDVGAYDDSEDEEEEKLDEDKEGDGESDNEEEMEEEEERDTLPTLTSKIEQLDPCLFTLSGLPPSSIRTLLNLDVIAQRNKPSEPVKQPPAAPFFLPTIAAAEGNTFDIQPMDADTHGVSQKPKRARNGRASNAPATLAEMLRSSAAALTAARAPPVERDVTTRETGIESSASMDITLDETNAKHGESDADAAIDAINAHLRQLNPAAIDLELRELATPLGVAETEHGELLRLGLIYFERAIARRVDFELMHGILHVFLKLHAAELARTASLAGHLRKITDRRDFGWGALQKSLQSNLCLLGFLGSSQL